MHRSKNFGCKYRCIFAGCVADPKIVLNIAMAILPAIFAPAPCQQSTSTGCYGIHFFDNVAILPYSEFPIKFGFSSFEKLPKLQFFLFRNSLSIFSPQNYFSDSIMSDFCYYIFYMRKKFEERK